MAHRPARSRFDTGVSLRTALKTEGASRRGIRIVESMVRQRLAPGGLSPIPRKIAQVSGARGLAVRTTTAIARRFFGGRTSQVQAIARQTAARPAVRLAAAGGAVVAAERAIEATTGRSPARMIFDLTRRPGRTPGQQTGLSRQRDVSRAVSPGGDGMQQSMQHVLVNQWQTFPGGPVFSRFADGHIEVTKKNGTIRHYRPYRPVVIPKKWDARAMRRVATALKRQRKTATKILQLTGGVPKRQERTSRRDGAHKSVDV